MKKISFLVLLSSALSFLLPGRTHSQWVQDRSIDSVTVNCFAYNGTNIFAGYKEKAFFFQPTTAQIGRALVLDCQPSKSGLSLFWAQDFFVGTEDGVFLSTNNGTNWTGVNSGLVKPPEGTDVFALAILDTEFFAATGQVFRSTNYGTTWTETDSGISTYDGVHSLAISGMNLFAGAYPGTAESRGGVYRSTNNGTSWTAVDSGWLFFDVGVYTLPLVIQIVFRNQFGSFSFH